MLRTQSALTTRRQALRRDVEGYVVAIAAITPIVIQPILKCRHSLDCASLSLLLISMGIVSPYSQDVLFLGGFQRLTNNQGMRASQYPSKSVSRKADLEGAQVQDFPRRSRSRDLPREYTSTL